MCAGAVLLAGCGPVPDPAAGKTPAAPRTPGTPSEAVREPGIGSSDGQAVAACGDVTGGYANPPARDLAAGDWEEVPCVEGELLTTLWVRRQVGDGRVG